MVREAWNSDLIEIQYLGSRQLKKTLDIDKL